MSSGSYENQWVVDEDILMSANGVVTRYTPDGRLIDPGERNYSKNDVDYGWSVPDGTVSHNVPFQLGPCGCIACNQPNILKGDPMDRNQVAQVAEAIGSSLMPDNSQWMNRFTIPSSSGSKVYTVAQRRSDGVWGCSCPAWINRRHCKHLVSILKQLAEVQLTAASDPAVLAMLASARTAYLDFEHVPLSKWAAPTPTYNRQIDL
jgi:roadblock/LC7 domain-containing protein